MAQRATSVSRDPRALASRTEVAGHLNVPEATLAQWAYKRIGPRYIRVGRHVRYRWSDVEAWLDEQQAS
jgi:predicted DNA-binding transcriptional regulator AlpA